MTRAAKQRLWLLGILTWTVLGLMSAAQNAAWRAYTDRPIDWVRIVPTSLADWLTCGMFTPAFFWMVRRFPIRGERWWSSLPIHLAASLVFVFLKVTAYTPLFNALNPGLHRTYRDVLFGGFYGDLLAYWGAVTPRRAGTFGRGCFAKAPHLSVKSSPCGGQTTSMRWR